MNTIDLEFDNDPVMALFEEKPKIPMAFVEDPVVLACTAYRLRTYLNFEQLVTTPEDRELGSRVRKHFMDKLVIQKLMGKPASAFREKLGAFLAGNQPLHKDELGMLYHLPYFYFEDLERDELISSTTEVQPQHPTKQTVVLSPLKISTLKRRGGAVKEFWWVDQNRHPYCISKRESAIDLTLYQSIWDFSKITVESQIFSKMFPGTSRFYYRMTNTRLLGIT